MSSILIRNVVLDKDITDVLIQDNLISAIGHNLSCPAKSQIIDGTNKAVLPTFANMHCHAPMALLRGYAGDKPLSTWLNDYIWPAERNLDEDTIYWGTRLACLEMIKSGTTAFNDMYFMLPHEAKAIHEAGIRCTLGLNVFGDAKDLLSEEVRDLRDEIYSYGSRMKLSIAPHAIYTVSPQGLQRCATLAQELNLRYHIHMSETETEVSNCRKEHQCRPYELLHQLGILEATQGVFVGAHSLHLSRQEISLIGRYKCCVAHNPCSNLKLGSGHFFPYMELKETGALITLGTDGCSSSNNLDMTDAAKFMAYLQKGIRQDPTILPYEELLEVSTANGFKAMGWNGGKVEENSLADLMLVDLDNIAFVPNHNTLENLFYAAHGDAIDTVICDGKILMQHHYVEGQEEVIAQARRCAQKLIP